MDRRDAIISITSVLGYTVTPASIISLSGSCTKEEPGVLWSPQFFQKTGASVIKGLGEAILPKTETPGSMDVGAHIFVDRFLKHVATEQDQQKCRLGLKHWTADYLQRKGKPLVEASANDLQQELAYLLDVDQQKQEKISDMINGDPPEESEQAKQYYTYSFLMTFKKLLMLGYYASEEVGENVLSYLPVPGRYDGCIPAEEVGYSWAL